MAEMLDLPRFGNKMASLPLLKGARSADDSLEGFAKFCIEYGVDEWIEETVDVSEPREEGEETTIHGTDHPRRGGGGGRGRRRGGKRGGRGGGGREGGG